MTGWIAARLSWTVRIALLWTARRSGGVGRLLELSWAVDSFDSTFPMSFSSLQLYPRGGAVKAVRTNLVRSQNANAANVALRRLVPFAIIASIVVRASSIL